MSENKRRAERFGVNEEFASIGEDVGVTYVSDLSENGVFLHTRHRIDVGELIELRFTLVVDDPVVIQGRGRVVRHAEEGMGVEFTQLGADMVLRIHDAIARQRSMRQESARLETQGVDARKAAEQKSFDDAKTGVYTVPEIPADQIVEHEDEADEG